MKKVLKSILLLTIFLSLMFSLVGCNGQSDANVDKEKEENEVEKEETKEPKVEKGFISFEKAKEVYNDEDYIFVDARLNDAYNGWKLDEISRGGHIPEATDFSYNWLSVDVEDRDKKLKKVLDEKGIKKNKNIVVYGVKKDQYKKVYDYLKNEGYENLKMFDLNKWIDSEKKLVKLPNYELIVPAKVVKDVLDNKKVETFENTKDVKVVEASWGEEKTSYKKGHIPTTFHINTDAIEPPPAWMLGSPEVLKEFALSHGFRKDDTVIVTSANQMAAYRVAVVLDYIGVKDVRVLNGGLAAWKRAGYKIEKESNQPKPVESFGAEIPANKDIIMTIPELKENLGNDDFTLVDNRTWKEHIGESSGYSYHDKKGRIPNSVYGYAGIGDAYSLQYFRNIDNTMRNPKEIKEMWKKQDIDLDNQLAFMCGSGWRAAEVLTYAKVFGLENTVLYSDGWIGWSNDPDNPVETGNPE